MRAAFHKRGIAFARMPKVDKMTSKQGIFVVSSFRPTRQDKIQNFYPSRSHPTLGK